MILKQSADKLKKVNQMKKKYMKYANSLSDSEFSKLKSLYLELIKYGEVLQSFCRDLHKKKLKVEGNDFVGLQANVFMNKFIVRGTHQKIVSNAQKTT